MIRKRYKEIKDINTRLESYCLGKGLIFVDNSNIDESCLNDSSVKRHVITCTEHFRSLEGHLNASQQTI